MNTSTSDRLRPESCALVLIDHQVGTLKLVKNLPLDRVIRSTIALAKVAVLLNIPVVLTSSQEDRLQGPLIPELKTLLPDAYAQRIQRDGIVNAWEDTGFRDAVIGLGRSQLIMAGITTDVCLVYPAIDAAREGFDVTAVMDASGSPFDDSEAFAQARMAAAGVTLTATNTAIAELAGRWSTPAGQKMIEILFKDLLPAIEREES